MKYRLVHLTGGLAGRVRDVDADEVVLGRDPDAAQVVFPAEDRSVSRRHALRRVQDGRVLLRNLDSSTGTFVDGHDVEEAELDHGDVFALGEHGPRVRVEMDDGGTITVDPRLVPAAARAAAPARAGSGPLPPAGRDSRLRLTFRAARRGAGLLLKDVPLPDEPLVVGRGEEAGLRLDSPIVSRTHARFTRRDGALAVEDLASSNGTFVAGRRVERATLADGD